MRRVRHAVRRMRRRGTRVRPFGTQIEQDALGAARGARDADCPAVPDQEVRPLDPGRARHDRHEVALDLLRIGLEREPEPPREAAHVRVHRDALAPAERVAADDGGGLAPHPGKPDELRRRARHPAAVALEHGQRRAAQGARLLVVEAGLEDRLGDLALARVGEGLRIGIAPEQPRRDHVDALIGALRGENRGDQQLPRRREVERAAGVGIDGAQAPQDRPHAALGRRELAEPGHARSRPCQPGAGQSRSSAGHDAQWSPARAAKADERSRPMAARTSAASSSASSRS